MRGGKRPRVMRPLLFVSRFRRSSVRPQANRRFGAQHHDLPDATQLCCDGNIPVRIVSLAGGKRAGACNIPFSSEAPEQHRRLATPALCICFCFSDGHAARSQRHRRMKSKARRSVMTARRRARSLRPSACAKPIFRTAGRAAWRAVPENRSLSAPYRSHVTPMTAPPPCQSERAPPPGVR